MQIILNTVRAYQRLLNNTASTALSLRFNRYHFWIHAQEDCSLLCRPPQRNYRDE